MSGGGKFPATGRETSGKRRRRVPGRKKADESAFHLLWRYIDLYSTWSVTISFTVTVTLCRADGLSSGSVNCSAAVRHYIHDSLSTPANFWPCNWHNLGRSSHNISFCRWLVETPSRDIHPIIECWAVSAVDGSIFCRRFNGQNRHVTAILNRDVNSH